MHSRNLHSYMICEDKFPSNKGLEKPCIQVNHDRDSYCPCILEIRVINKLCFTVDVTVSRPDRPSLIILIFGSQSRSVTRHLGNKIF